MKKVPVGVPCGPAGLAINPKSNQALLGCNNKKSEQTVVWDLTGMKVVKTFPDAGAGDATIYDAKADRFLLAASNFTKGGQPAPELAIFSGDPVSFLSAVATASGSHAVAYDETSKVVYTQGQKNNDGGLFAFPLS